MRNYILFFIGLILSGCGQKAVVEHELSRVKSYMHSQPDSALSIIQKIDPSDISRRSTRARYSLLYSQALDKNAIDLTSDSLIRPAVEYYNSHGRKIDKAKCWYYLARIYENSGDLDNAIKSYVHAEQYMVDTRARRLLAMLYANVGNLYIQQNSFEDADRMCDKAIHTYRGLNTVNEVFAMCDKARLLHLQAQHEQALVMLERAESVAMLHHDPGSFLNIAHSKAAVLSDMGADLNNQQQVVHSILSAYHEYNNGVLNPDSYLLLTDSYYRMNRLDSAAYYAAKALESIGSYTINQSVGLHVLLARIYEDKNELDKANACLYTWIELSDSLNKIEKTNLIQDMEQKYRTLQLRDSYDELQTRHITISIFSLLLLVIAGGIIWIIYRRKQAQINDYYNFIDSLRSAYSTLQDKYTALEKEVGQHDDKTSKLFEALDNRLKSLRKIMEMASTFEENPGVFYEKLRKHIKIESNQSGKALGDLFNITNLYHGGIVDYLQANYPNLNDEDLALSCMICLEFSPQQTRLLFNHTNTSSIYTKRSKLRRKLEISDADNLEEFFKSCIREHGKSS